MREKRHTREDILIDLTSLLDVVFIVILVVLAGQKNNEQSVVQRENNVAALEKQLAEREEEANSKYELYLDQLEMADNMYQYVIPVSINVGYLSPDMKERKINVLTGGETTPVEFNLKGENVEALDHFKKMLEETIRNNTEKLVVFSLNENEEDILWRDEKSITEILEELKNNNDNVR